jgi:hypothetical protein
MMAFRRHDVCCMKKKRSKMPTLREEIAARGSNLF